MKAKSSNQDDIVSRKADHIKLCLDDSSQDTADLFSDVQIPYRALPECNLEDVSTETTLLGKKLSQPLIISSMTGGTTHGIKINTNLAKAAESQQVALGVGSQRIAIENPEAIKTFSVIRKHAPTALVFANMGAIQLNYGYGLSEFQRVVDMIQADAIYLHINPLQEAIQPGGDTDYKDLSKKIAALVKKISVPVFIKEVGHGIDLDTAKMMIGAGVAGIDVAGVGGTSYAWVEANRAENQDFAEWFKTVGIRTDQAIRQIAPVKKNTTLVASGGIRNPVQGYKAHLLGADLYASTRPFLQASLEDSQAVVQEIQKWQIALQIAMFSAGQTKW